VRTTLALSELDLDWNLASVSLCFLDGEEGVVLA
jgi:hypothetical protein